MSLYEDDFSVQSQAEILSAATASTDTFTLFLGGVAAISLIVGGIGIMNIMLVTVTERTREIGIRKALGARSRDIQLQFLVEATVLSVLGGILGVVVGLGFTEVVKIRPDRWQHHHPGVQCRRDPAGHGLLADDRHLFRLLPGQSRGFARPDRGLAL